MLEDIIKAYNKTKINGRYLYNCYLEPSIKSDLALSDYFSRLNVNKLKDNDSIFFSLLKFTGNDFYRKASPYYIKYSQVKKIKNQNLPIICYNEETQNQIQRSVFEAKNPLSSNFDKIIVNKISLGDFACMEFVFTNSFQNSSEALKKYYSKENGKPISIIVATSSFINLINKEYRFHIERIPHLMKMFKNHQAQRSVNNEDLIKAFLQNAKEKESYPVYGNILSSIRDLKGSGNNKDKKILNYLKRDIDISSNKTGQVIQELAKHKEFYDLVLVIHHTTKTTSPVEVARAISEHYAVCDDKDLKISLEGYLKKLGFSLEEFSSSSNVFSKVINTINDAYQIEKDFLLKGTSLKEIASACEKKAKALQKEEKFSDENFSEKAFGALTTNYFLYIDFTSALTSDDLCNIFIKILIEQYKEILNLKSNTPLKYKTCLEKCLSIFGVNSPKRFESLYQNKSPLSDITTRNKIEYLLSQIKDKNMKQYANKLYSQNKEKALNQIYCNLDEQKQDEKDIKHKLAKIIPSLKEVSKFSYFKCTKCGDISIEKLPIENRQCEKCNKGIVSSTLLYQEMQKIRINQDIVTDCVKFYFTQREKYTTRQASLKSSLLYSQTKVKSINIKKVLESLRCSILGKSLKNIQDILFTTFLLFKGTELELLFGILYKYHRRINNRYPIIIDPKDPFIQKYVSKKLKRNPSFQEIIETIKKDCNNTLLFSTTTDTDPFKDLKGFPSWRSENGDQNFLKFIYFFITRTLDLYKNKKFSKELKSKIYLDSELNVIDANSIVFPDIHDKKNDDTLMTLFNTIQILLLYYRNKSTSYNFDIFGKMYTLLDKGYAASLFKDRITKKLCDEVANMNSLEITLSIKQAIEKYFRDQNWNLAQVQPMAFLD